MSAMPLRKQAEELTKKAHELEERMHTLPERVDTPEELRLREQLIDITMRIDKIKEELGEKREVEY